MKLSFSRRNYLCDFLRGTTVATLLLSHSLSHSVGAIAKTPQQLGQIAELTPPQLESPFRWSSGISIKEERTGIWQLSRKGDFLVSSIDPPSPPIPPRSGGSR